MPATEHLPYTVNLWAEDELSIEEVLASAAHLSIARAAFDAAALSYPHRALSLMDGPRTIEVRPAKPVLRKVKPERGLTTDARRLRNFHRGM